MTDSSPRRTHDRQDPACDNKVGPVLTRQRNGWRLVLVYGDDNEENSEVSLAGCTGRRFADKQLAEVVSHKKSDRDVVVRTALVSFAIV